MNGLIKICIAGLLVVSPAVQTSAREWTLADCVNYALANNISLKKSKVQQLSALEDVKQSQAALLPSLDFSTSQNVTYRPWPETGRQTVANGYGETSVDKTFYNGSYSLSGNWTVWNGGRNTNQVKLNKLTEQQAVLDSAQTANTILEQIAQLYVQILYSNEAIGVNKASLETSRANEERGKTMLGVGKMSKADLAQLTAQRAQDEFNVVEAESNLRNYKRQLKEILQITGDEEFDIAVEHRPEVKAAELGVEGSGLSAKIAKAQRLPSVGLNVGVSTNTTSMSDNAWGSQMKNNMSVGGGFTVSVPLFDNRKSKTAANKAMLQRESYMLDLKDKQTTLYSTVENYWLQAVTNQNKFKAARVSTQSAKDSYELLSEQFRLGLKNIVELMTGKNNLLTAQQNELQSKYLTILNLNMLSFYKTGELK